MIRKHRRALALAGLAVPVLLFGRCSPSAEGSDLEQDLARIRDVTDPFHDVAAARAAGYPPVPPEHCLESEAGGMGYHHVNAALMDDRLEVERPEIVVYAPAADGERKLAGVEYAVPYSARPPDENPPRILGQDLKRADGLQLWYLHVWLWEANEKGLFADWNPAVDCPERAANR